MHWHLIGLDCCRTKLAKNLSQWALICIVRGHNFELHLGTTSKAAIYQPVHALGGAVNRHQRRLDIESTLKCARDSPVGTLRFDMRRHCIDANTSDATFERAWAILVLGELLERHRLLAATRTEDWAFWALPLGVRHHSCGS